MLKSFHVILVRGLSLSVGTYRDRAFYFGVKGKKCCVFLCADSVCAHVPEVSTKKKKQSEGTAGNTEPWSPSGPEH